MDKSVIHKLSDDVISKLAYSNFINSPSCVLKELLENSFDASSSKITIHIEGAGIKLIRVIDNGVGIYKADLHKIGVKYNTSKISKFEDLNNVKTYGFRGESLSIIKAISKMQITSKPYDQDIAYKAIFFDNNDNFIVSPSAGVNGTVVEVRDLFYNNLDLKVFLKDFDYECAKIHSIFKQMVLSRFDVHFVLFQDGVESRNFPACNDNFSKLKRIEMVNENFILNNVIDINFTDVNISLYGFICANNKKKFTQCFKFFFINNRIVNANIIDDVFLDIFNLKLKKKILVSYCLYLYLDPTLYSVIFSSKKLDVFFKDYFFVYNFLFNFFLNEFFTKKHFIDNNKNSDLVIKNSFKNSDSNNFFCMNLSKKELYNANNTILTVLNNSDVFFSLNDKVYVIKLDILRIRVVYNLFLFQYSKFGKILKKNVICCELFDFDLFAVFLELKDLLLVYGLCFEMFGDKFLIVRSIPVLLYNLSINWINLFSELKNFLEKSVLSNFSKNRFDSNIVNIFVKHIHKESLCNLYEINLFYKELLNSNLNDIYWFNKNCYEVVCKKS